MKVDAVGFIGGYRATQIPRYEGEEIEVYINDNINKQKIFWAAIINELNRRKAFSYIVELRFSSDPNTQTIIQDILCWGNSKNSTERNKAIISLVENLLPEEYAWHYLDCPNVFDTNNSQSKDWSVSRLVRRTHFLDLPSTRPFDIEENHSFNLIRQIPTSETSFSSVEADPFCIPIPTPIDFDERSQRRIFGYMQKMSPCIVSFTCSAIDLDMMPKYRQFLLFWRNFLSMNKHDNSTQEESEHFSINSLSNGLDGFILPDTQLCNLQLTILSKSTERSKAIARYVASRIGGLRTYSIRTKKEYFNSDQIPKLWNEIPSSLLNENDLQFLYNKICQQLKGQNIQIPEENNSNDVHFIIKILSSLPYIYTIDDAQKILEFPRAEKDGMPGFDTALLPPFVGAINKPDPVVINHQIASASNNKLRIGIARPGGSIAPQPCAANHDDNAMVELYRDAHWHTMDIGSLTKHAFIVGSTGSGKTMTTQFLVREFARLKIPFLIIEPVKTEYYDALKKFKDKIPITRLRFEGNEKGERGKDFLAFDPMRIPAGVSVSRHASYLKSCFLSAFPLEDLPLLLLESGIMAYYTGYLNDRACNYKPFQVVESKPAWERDGIIAPSLPSFFYFFKTSFLKKVFNIPLDRELKECGLSRHQIEIYLDFKQLFERRFEILEKGLIGQSAKAALEEYKRDSSTYETLAPYLNKNTIIELDAIPDGDQKSLLMAFLMTYLFERRQGDDFVNRNKEHADKVKTDNFQIDGLKHVLIIEEAHRILSNPGLREGGQTAKSKSVGLFVDMLAEIRALGQGLIIVEQIPTKIIPEAVKNTNLKIMLRLTSKDDREYLGEAMSFTEQQKQFVTKLRAKGGHGIDMVIFEEGVDQPLMLNLPLPEKKDDNWLFNEFFD